MRRMKRDLSARVGRPGGDTNRIYDSERHGRSGTFGDRLDSLEGAQHVTPVATLPQEPTERAPNLGEEVIAEVE